MTTRGTAKISDSQYLYDLVGNITNFTNGLTTPAPVAPNTVIAPGPVTQNFVYDDLYQLTSASGGYTGCACGCGNSRGYTLTMQYDGLGNITRKNQTDTIFQPSGATTPQVATTYNNGYTYGATQSSGQKAGPHAPTGVGAETISYDFDGNQTQYSGSFGPTRSLTWTEDDRLRTETDSGFTNTFLYDADGTRTHKRRTTLETWYVNPFYVVKNSLTESKHIMLGNEKIVTAVATITNRADPTTAGTNTLFFYHPDHLQSTSYMTGGDGSILQHDEYFPSGEVWFQEQKNNDARNTQPYLFNAKELDETGLYYFGARYYNPKLSVWISTDPILAGYVRGEVNGGVFSPRNLGLYTYSFNNPVVLRDPDGLAPTAEQVRKFREGTLDVNKEMASGRMTVNEAIDLYRAGGFTDVRSYENGDTSRFIPALAELMVKAYLVGKSAMEAFGGLLEHLGEAGATGAGAGSPPVVSPGPSGGELPPAGSPPSPGGASPEFHSVYGDGTLVPEGQQPPRIPPGADPGSGQLNTPAEGAHTRLRLDPNQGNRVYQGREIDAAGHPVRDVDFTNPTYKSGHPRPGHPGPPHQHQWTPVDPANPKAGYRREKLPEPM
jgi:RHS repeat-associated protein